MPLDPKELKLYESLLIQKKLRGLEDLHYFNKYVIESDPTRRELLVPHVHGEWTTWFETAVSRVRVMLVPRSTFKSTFFTENWSLQQIANNKNIRILIANATLANAQRFLGNIKDHLQNNEIYKTLYGGMYDPHLKWNEDEIVVKGRKKGVRESTVTAVGVGGNLVSQHYDIIIADDLVNDINSATRYQAQKVIEWWKKSFSLLEPNGIMLIIGTRWSYFELYSHLQKEFKDEFDFYVRGAYNPDGTFYFPERFSGEKLKELKALHGSYIFSAFYLNDPVDEEKAIIKESQVKYYGKGEKQKLPAIVNTFSMCDPAVSDPGGGDFSTIVTVSVDSFNNWFVREIRRGRWTVGELMEELFSVNKRWKPITMSIEVIGMGQALLTSIHEEEEKKKVYLPLTPIKVRPPIKKLGRIRATLQPRFEQGKVFLGGEMDELKEELLRFPKSAHDDMIDALTDCIDIAFTPDEKKEEEKSGNYFESQLQEQFNRGTTYVDPVLGEHV